MSCNTRTKCNEKAREHSRLGSVGRAGHLQVVRKGVWRANALQNRGERQPYNPGMEHNTAADVCARVKREGGGEEFHSQK